MFFRPIFTLQMKINICAELSLRFLNFNHRYYLD